MADDKEKKLLVQVGDPSGPTEFRTWEHLRKWVRSEGAYWEWLRDTQRTYNPGSISSVVNAFDSIEGHIETYRTAGHSMDVMRSMIEENFSRSTGSLRLSTSEVGALILDIKDAAGEAAAAFAYAYHLGAVNLSNGNPEQVRGAILFIVPGLVEPAALATRLSKERANYRSAQISAADRIEKIREEQSTEFKRLLKRGFRLSIRALRMRRDAWTNAQGVWTADATDAVAEIRATDQAFKEQMRLQAPVEYWRGKEAEHSKAEQTARRLLYLFFPAALALLLTAFLGAAAILLNATAVPSTVYVIISGGLLSMAALTFWIGRLLTKIYLSERHLRHDAGERAVMTTTYLALTRERAAEEADRQIILGALFRQTTDGIVKEDGPAELSLGALIGKAATR